MKLSQKERILNYLLTGRSLTGLQALYKFGSFKLSSRCSELISEGYSIQKKMVHKDGKSFMKYWI